MNQAEFEIVVENMYGYQFQPGEVWTLFGDTLIVAHPDKPPRAVFLDGQIEEIRFDARSR